MCEGCYARPFRRELDRMNGNLAIAGCVVAGDGQISGDDFGVCRGVMTRLLT